MERDDFGLPVRRSLRAFAEEKARSENKFRRESRGPSPLTTEEKLSGRSVERKDRNVNNMDDCSSQTKKAPQKALDALAGAKVSAAEKGEEEKRRRSQQKSAPDPTDRNIKYQSQDSKMSADITLDKVAPDKPPKPHLSSTISATTTAESGIAKGARSRAARDARKSIAYQQTLVENRGAEELEQRKIAQNLYLRREREKFEEQQRKDMAKSQRQEQPRQQEQPQQPPPPPPQIGTVLYTEKEALSQNMVANEAVEVQLPTLEPNDIRNCKPLSSDEIRSTGVHYSTQIEKGDEENQAQTTKSSITFPSDDLNIEKTTASPATDSSQRNIEDQNVQRNFVCLPGEDEDRIIRFLYKHKMYGFPGSNGGYLSNFWHYFKNDHPLFSICLCHQLNPYTKRNRAIVYICVTTMAYCLTVGLMETDYIVDNNVCRAGCDVATSESTGECACSGGMNDGRSCSSFNNLCAYVSPIAIGALCGAFVAIYGAILRAFATFGCCQGNRFLQTKCTSCINFTSVFGGHLLTFFLGFSVCLLIVVLLTVKINPQQQIYILSTFGASKLFSAVYW